MVSGKIQSEFCLALLLLWLEKPQSRLWWNWIQAQWKQVLCPTWVLQEPASTGTDWVEELDPGLK